MAMRYVDYITGKGVLGTLLLVVTNNTLTHDKINVTHVLLYFIEHLPHGQ